MVAGSQYHRCVPRPLSGRRFVDALRARVSAGKPIDPRTAQRLIRGAERMQIAEADALAAVSTYWAARDRFSLEDQRGLEQALSHLSILPNTNKPAAARARHAVSEQPEHASMVFIEREARWGAVGGVVVKDGVSRDDPLQGKLEDCFFIAALSAVAHADPSRVERILKNNGDGTFTATFWGRRAHAAPLEPYDVVIDGRLPVWRGRLVYGQGADPKELWPALLEKAYAKWKGNYLFCFDDVAGLPGDALSALLGKDPEVLLVLPSSDPDAVFTRLRDALAAGGCVVAGTRSHDPVVERAGLESGHEYTVLAASTAADGTRSVTLRNPRGPTTTIPLRTFLDHVDLVDICLLAES